MTESEQAIVNEYAEVQLKFSSYYKFVFTFTGVAPDGAIISCDYGGNSDEIYRYECSLSSVEKLGTNPSDFWMAARIKKDDEEIFSGYWY